MLIFLQGKVYSKESKSINLHGSTNPRSNQQQALDFHLLIRWYMNSGNAIID